MGSESSSGAAGEKRVEGAWGACSTSRLPYGGVEARDVNQRLSRLVGRCHPLSQSLPREAREVRMALALRLLLPFFPLPNAILSLGVSVKKPA